jgi:hypothetical protein
MSKYIEINDDTRPYLAQLKHPTTKDLVILRQLLHDKQWWGKFNKASSQQKHELLSVMKDIKKDM